MLETLHVTSSLSTNMLKTEVVILGAQLNLVLRKESSSLLSVQVDLHVRAMRMFLLINSSQLPISRLLAKPPVTRVACNTYFHFRMLCLSNMWLFVLCSSNTSFGNMLPNQRFMTHLCLVGNAQFMFPVGLTLWMNGTARK